MKHGEFGSWERSLPGAYIGSLLMNKPNALPLALAEDAWTAAPIEQRRLGTPEDTELGWSLAEEAAHASQEGDDTDERKMVFWRGLQWARLIAKQALPLDSPPELALTPDGEELEDDARMGVIVPGAFQMTRHFGMLAHIAQDCYPAVDPSWRYVNYGRCSVLIGFYLIDNGERAKIRRVEEEAAEEEMERIDAEFFRIRDAEELEAFTAIAYDLTVNQGFKVRPE